METAKNCLNIINAHWIVVVATGMYTHIRQICIIGLCYDEENVPFDPSYASILFIFSVLCLLAEYKLWPRSLKEPPMQLMYIYEMLISALITNLATRAVWIPLMQVICYLTQESSKWLLWLNTTLGLGRYSFLTVWSSYMAKEMAAMHMAFCMALLAFVWMLDATESLEGILDTWAKDMRRPRLRLLGLSKPGKRIVFEDPKVTNWYTYTLPRGGPTGETRTSRSVMTTLFDSYQPSVLFLTIGPVKVRRATKILTCRRRNAEHHVLKMARLVCTFWALLFNILDLTIFQTCFASAMEDEDGEPLISGPPITSFFFAAGVYVIIVKFSLFPSSFKKPNAALLCAYEFLVMAFFLEFAMACIWTPIEVLIVTTLPKTMCHVVTRLGYGDIGDWIVANKHPMSILSYAIALSFFFLSLHITKSVDYTVFTECGTMIFLRYVKCKLRQRIMSEIPKTSKVKRTHRKKSCRRRRRSRSRSESRDST